MHRKEWYPYENFTNTPPVFGVPLINCKLIHEQIQYTNEAVPVTKLQVGNNAKGKKIYFKILKSCLPPQKGIDNIVLDWNNILWVPKANEHVRGESLKQRTKFISTAEWSAHVHKFWVQRIIFLILNNIISTNGEHG